MSLILLIILLKSFPQEFLVLPLAREFSLAEFIAKFGRASWFHRGGAGWYDWISCNFGSDERDHSTRLDGVEERGGGGGVEK